MRARRIMILRPGSIPARRPTIRGDSMKYLVAALVLASGITPTARADERPPTASFVLEEAGIADLQQRMKAGELTAHAITQLYLDRIAAIDKAGPAINTVI